MNTETLLDLMSAGTLASLIDDIDRLSKGADAAALAVRFGAYGRLVAIVGSKETEMLLAIAAETQSQMLTAGK